MKTSEFNTVDINQPGNVQGDEMVARAWFKYLSRNPKVSQVNYYNLEHKTNESSDKIVIHFHQNLNIVENALNILYFQNAYPDPPYIGGSLKQFNDLYKRDIYDAFLFPSQLLADICMEDKIEPYASIPFATDPELFYPMDSDPQYHSQVVMVGNNIRGEAVNEKYIAPAIPHLTLYGNPAGWPQKYLNRHKGKLPINDEAVLYCSSSICLNAHITEHIKYDTINFRIYNILACGGFVISDKIPSLESEFKDSVVTTDGNQQLFDAITHYLCNPQDTSDYRKNGMQLVLSRHTFKHRCDKLADFLETLI